MLEQVERNGRLRIMAPPTTIVESDIFKPVRIATCLPSIVAGSEKGFRLLAGCHKI